MRAVEVHEIRSFVSGRVPGGDADELVSLQIGGREIERIRRPVPFDELVIVREERDALERGATVVLDADFEVGDPVGGDGSRNLGFDRILPLVDDERVGIDVMPFPVVSDCPHLHPFRDLAEVELGVERRPVAGLDLLSFDPELDAFDRWFRLHVDAEEVRCEVPLRRKDVDRTRGLGNDALRDERFRPVRSIGNVRLSDRLHLEFLSRLREDHRSRLELRQKSDLDRGFPGRKRSDHGEAARIRRLKRPAEVSNDLPANEDRALGEDRRSLRDVARERVTERHAHHDVSVTISERRRLDGEVLLLGGSGRRCRCGLREKGRNE